MINPANARLWTEVPASALLEETVDLVNATIRDLLTTNINRRLALESLLFMLQEAVQMPRVVGVRFGRAGKTYYLIRMI